nr:hypothetical protein [uncultured Desulfobacter sp.]
MICKLCKQDKPLRNSHIIPEFFYSSIYDERHRFYIVSTAPGERRGIRPKGIYEKLLCETCEDAFGDYDDYGRKVLFGGASIEIPKNYPDAYVTSNINYRKFKLFSMSLLWRASVSERIEFKITKLGGPHEERLRQMLYDKNPGEPYEYGCILMVENNKPEVMDLMGRLILPPEKLQLRIEGHRVFRAAFGNLWWVWVVSNHTKSFSKQKVFMDQHGTLPIIKAKSHGFSFLKNLTLELEKKGMLDD